MGLLKGLRVKPIIKPLNVEQLIQELKKLEPNMIPYMDVGDGYPLQICSVARTKYDCHLLWYKKSVDKHD